VLDQLHTSISVYDRSGVIAELEDRLRDYFDVRHAVLTSSGTAALHSAYVASYIEPGDEVIVPAYTFPATATPLLHLGAVPVLADSDETGNVSVDDVASRISRRTAAIMVTHLWGVPADLKRLGALASQHGLVLLEDGSHAHGATIRSQMIGSVGHTAAFSMNGPKPLSAGEGGFVLTNNDEVFYRLLLHGHYNKRCRTEIPSSHPLHQYAVSGMGLKLRIHPLAAAIALAQLSHLDHYLAGRRAIAHYLCGELGQLPGIAAPAIPEGAAPSWYRLPLTYLPEELGDLPIEDFYKALQAEGCHALDRPGSTGPLNRLPLFRYPEALFPHHPALGRVRYRSGQFPVAEQIYQHTLTLPVWHRVEDRPLADRYIEAFRKVTAHHHELRGHA
jgi:dTDP-4-amino-4,6-dideoxygalactose transaminase